MMIIRRTSTRKQMMGITGIIKMLWDDVQDERAVKISAAAAAVMALQFLFLVLTCFCCCCCSCEFLRLVQ